jgi:DNA-binding response OmpR family regulator
VAKPNENNGGDSAALASIEQDVLIVDDDARAAGALAMLLTQAGYRTSVAHNGHDAMCHAKGQPISAAIVDVHLPDLNGLVLSMNLRELLGNAAPIFVVSGDTSMETINSLSHVGATYFFAKPLSPAHVIERLRDCLPKAEG